MRTHGSHNRIVSLKCAECNISFGARTTQPKLCPECAEKEKIRQRREYYKRQKGEKK